MPKYTRRSLACAAILSFAVHSDVYADPNDPIPYAWEDTLKPTRMLELQQQYLQFIKRNPTHLRAHEILAQGAFVLWRLEKQDNRRRLGYAKLAVQMGKEMIKIAPNRPEGYHWVGAGLGMIGLTRGVLNSLQIVAEIRRNFEKSYELDPSYLNGSAMVQMARLYTMVPGFPISIGDKEKALQLLLKAKEIGPNFTLTHVYLADLYWHFGKTLEALAVLDEMARRKPTTEVEFFLNSVNAEKAKELRKLITAGVKRDPFYDVLSDIQPGLVD